MSRKHCRCTARLNDAGECPYKCPPVVKRRVLSASKPHAARKAPAVLAIAFWLLASTRTAGADETPRVEPPTQCVCREPENGARPGESLEARAERLERAFRLTRAEVRVNNTRKVRK